jgi:hypothetical protein
MPNADGKTSLARGNYKIDPNNGGFSNFSDDFAVGFTPLINEKFNIETEDSSQFTLSALSLGHSAAGLGSVDGRGVDFFSNKDAPGFFKHIEWLGTYSVFNKSENSAIVDDSYYGFNIGDSSLMTGTFDNQFGPDIANAFDVDNAPLEPSENLESIYSNINAAGQEIETLFDEYLPGQVKEGQPNYDSYNSIPEPMLDKYLQGGSQYGLHGLKDTRPPEPSIPNFAEVAYQSQQALNNAQGGGGIESMIISDPQGQTQVAVGMGIEATGGGAQDLQALAEPGKDVTSTLDSALNNINPNYNNSFNGIL